MTDKQIQCLLTYLGYDCGPIDGIAGVNTQKALTRFKSDYGVGAEGLVGAVAKTLAKLDKPKELEEQKTGTFWDDIQYFTRHEFRCPCGKCGGFPVEPTESIVRESDSLRKHLGIPVIIVPPDGHSGGSGVRCQTYNDSLKGSVPNSTHVKGKAVDFSAPGAPTSKIQNWLAQEKSAGRLSYYYQISSGSWHMNV